MTQIRRLTASRSHRREQGLFLGDGVKLLEEALKWHAPLDTVMLTEGVDIPDLPDGVRLVQVPRDVMASISPMDSPQGALFLCRMWDTAPPPCRRDCLGCAIWCWTGCRTQGTWAPSGAPPTPWGRMD